MFLDLTDLQEIESRIMFQVHQELTTAMRGGEDELAAVLKRWHYDYVANTTDDYTDQARKRVLVIGKAEVPEKYLRQEIVKLQLDPEKFDFILEYDHNYDFAQLKNSDKYADVIVGAMGHSQKGKGKSGSAISELMLHPEYYPHTIECRTSGGKLKITRQAFSDALKETILYQYECAEA